MVWSRWGLYVNKLMATDFWESRWRYIEQLGQQLLLYASWVLKTCRWRFEGLYLSRLHLRSMSYKSNSDSQASIIDLTRLQNHASVEHVRNVVLETSHFHLTMELWLFWHSNGFAKDVLWMSFWGTCPLGKNFSMLQMILRDEFSSDSFDLLAYLDVLILIVDRM